MNDKFKIWSFEHNAWWAPDAGGYTTRFEDAGIYSYDVAHDICLNANVNEDETNEAMVPIPEPKSF